MLAGPELVDEPGADARREMTPSSRQIAGERCACRPAARRAPPPALVGLLGPVEVRLERRRRVAVAERRRAAGPGRARCTRRAPAARRRASRAPLADRAAQGRPPGRAARPAAAPPRAAASPRPSSAVVPRGFGEGGQLGQALEAIVDAPQHVVGVVADPQQRDARLRSPTPTPSASSIRRSASSGAFAARAACGGFDRVPRRALHVACRQRVPGEGGRAAGSTWSPRGQQVDDRGVDRAPAAAGSASRPRTRGPARG